MVLKKYKNPKGGLNEAGRKHFERKDGGNLKAPVPKGKNPRRVSFAARFAGMKGPMKDAKGRPTRKALALKNGVLAQSKRLVSLPLIIRKNHNAYL